MKQTTFASAAWDRKGKVTRRERFLAEMDAVIPWRSILGLIEPHYPKAGNGTQPMPMERMLRIYFMQQWFNLSDPAMEDSLYDSESMRRFAGIELVDDAVPDEIDDPALSPPARAAPADRADLCPGARAAGAEAAAAQVRHDRGCDDHRCAALDQERGEGARSGDAAGQEG